MEVKQISVYLLGNFKIIDINGKDITPRSHKACCLLAYLALSPQGTALREDLAKLFWSRVETDTALSSLRQAVFQINKSFQTLSENIFLSQAKTLTLNTTSVWVDIHQLSRLSPEHSTPPEIHLKNLVQLWQGDLLANISSKEATITTWIKSMNEEWRAIMLTQLNITLKTSITTCLMHASENQIQRLLLRQHQNFSYTTFCSQLITEHRVIDAWHYYQFVTNQIQSPSLDKYKETPNTKTTASKMSLDTALATTLLRQKSLSLRHYHASLLMGCAWFFLWQTNPSIDPEKIPTSVMLKIPRGNFTMGCSPSDAQCDANEEPTHSVNIDTFLLGATEVTFEQYDFYCKHTKTCELPHDESWGRAYRPVINISWFDAKNYVQWLNQQTGQHFRLPTEAEWEYAARAGSSTPYYWGNAPDSSYANGSDEDGWPHDKFKRETAPVAYFEANAWGLHDVQGNVWEWCEDTWHDNYHRAPRDASAWTADGTNHRVIRGGSWSSGPNSVRISRRFKLHPASKNVFLGFRLAQDIDDGDKY